MTNPLRCYFKSLLRGSRTALLVSDNARSSIVVGSLLETIDEDSMMDFGESSFSSISTIDTDTSIGGSSSRWDSMPINSNSKHDAAIRKPVRNQHDGR